MASDYRLFFLDYDDFTNRRRFPLRYVWLWSCIMSILSFKDRGKWGKSSYRGNCSGFVYQEMFSWLKPMFLLIRWLAQ
jgi:hypothetical protein